MINSALSASKIEFHFVVIWSAICWMLIQSCTIARRLNQLEWTKPDNDKITIMHMNRRHLKTFYLEFSTQLPCSCGDSSKRIVLNWSSRSKRSLITERIKIQIWVTLTTSLFRGEERASINSFVCLKTTLRVPREISKLVSGELCFSYKQNSRRIDSLQTRQPLTENFFSIFHFSFTIFSLDEE